MPEFHGVSRKCVEHAVINYALAMSTMSSPQVQAATPRHEKYSADNLSEIRSDLAPKIPSVDPEKKKLVQSSCVLVVAAQKSRDAAKNVQNKASTLEEQEAANNALRAAEEALTQAVQVAIQASAPLIADLDKTRLHNDTLDSLLCPCSVLLNATPKRRSSSATRRRLV